ncbi:MAG: ribonucleoside-diphosphate reductase, adenosylcobalamin-dependent [Osedax symbiont Rs1]|nr:MAG: ribonucleoside-diphosphate reductase, adenosylcobalamin-dependent [Osedax symbiont Rs1]
MKAVQNFSFKEKIARKIPLQAASFDIWDIKYCLKDSNGVRIDSNVEASLDRVAYALAEVEEDQELRVHWYKKFLWALQQGATPAGRIISNAGAQHYKPATSTINCTVSDTLHDSLDDILSKNLQAGLTLKAGCGIGYEFSTLRPKGAYVTGSGVSTSGPLAFMDIFDQMCFAIFSTGRRRGAQMATFDIGHPDVLDFITAKREDARLRQFNLSLLITNRFMQAVQDDDDWPLAFPLSTAQQTEEAIDLDDSNLIIWRDWPITEGYVTNNQGLVACKISKFIKAKKLWNLIMASTYDFAEPGFILIDEVNSLNNNWFCENIRATNSCGEQPLPPSGACLLGSINLTKFVLYPFTEKACFDWDRFKETVSIFTRMLDNVIEINGLPLAEQRAEMLRKRRHGMGYLGLGSVITMLRMRYGDKDSVIFTERVSKELAMTGWRTGLALAKEKGSAPIMEEEFVISAKMLRQRPAILDDGYQLGDKIKGRVLHAKYSRYMQKIAVEDSQLVADLAEFGCRFTHHGSIAPTGTIALSLGNNVSNGIEPSFAHHYARNITWEGKKTKKKVDVFSYELLAYRAWVNDRAMPGSMDANTQLPKYFIAADDIQPNQHVDIQAAAQIWMDASISKTINIATDYPFEKFKDIYQYAYRQGLKGCTTFRFNPENFQGVLVTERNLANTRYQFTLEDGSVVEFSGDQDIEYDGETHNVANLYDALKEGYYGKL